MDSRRNKETAVARDLQFYADILFRTGLFPGVVAAIRAGAAPRLAVQQVSSAAPLTLDKTFLGFHNTCQRLAGVNWL